MRLETIQVESVPDDRGEDVPRRLRREEVVIEVGEVLDRWYQPPGNPEWPAANYFKVIGYDFCEYLLKHDLESRQWFLLQEWAGLPGPYRRGRRG